MTEFRLFITYLEGFFRNILRLQAFLKQPEGNR